MKYQGTQRLYEYWNGLRGDRPAPNRREIDPADIRELLGDTFILEVDQTFGTVSFRLAGTRLCNAYGRELKGLGFLALWDESDNLNILNAIRNVHKQYLPCFLECMVESQGGRDIDYEIILLPLQNDSADTIRILGAATPQKNQIWLGADPLVNNRMKGVNYYKNEIPAKNTANGEPFYSKSWHEEQDSHKQVAHLRVIEGGLL